jgi:hypothetical protein
MDPTEAECLHVVADGEEIAVGSTRTLVAIDSPGHPTQRQKLETLNGIHSNAGGFRRWLDGRQKAS